MKATTTPRPRREERRRFLSLLGALGAMGLTLPHLPWAKGPKELDLKEAEFYRPHDLAG